MLSAVLEPMSRSSLVTCLDVAGNADVLVEREASILVAGSAYLTPAERGFAPIAQNQQPTFGKVVGSRPTPSA